MLELLSPAGSMEALRAAVQNGADAVYLGCGSFNARQSAKNFTAQALEEAVKYCHIRGVKVHLTLNTLVTDREIPEAIELIRQAAAAGVDAVIVLDLGVVRLVRQVAPTLQVHGSTQMSVHSLAGVLLCAAWGMSRVVLSRELERSEIEHICRNSPIEIEVFAHGALCMCYSGQCYLSAVIGSRSGNRGRCAQPCRLAYGFGRYENKYPLSLKDNCLVEYLQDLERMGVASVKLEGRMKRPEYVATVTGVYRQAMDQGGVTRPMVDALMTAFNRQGFTGGYFLGQIGPHMFGVREETWEDPKWLQEARMSYEGVERSRVPVSFFAIIKDGESQLAVQDNEGRVCKVTGPEPETARNKPLTDQELALRLSKTGGTPYYCAQVKASIQPGLTLSAAAINSMRRSALDRLTALRARREPVQLNKPPRCSSIKGGRETPGVTVQVTELHQITDKVLTMQPRRLYVPLHLIASNMEYFRDLVLQVKVAAVMPRIIHDDELPKIRQQLALCRELGIREALVGNLGHLLPAREEGFLLRGDFGLNLFNSYAMDMARDLELESATLSFEMTLPQIRDVSKAMPCELLVYGRLPLMVTENCIIKNKTGQCSCHHGPTKLTDRTGADFPIIKDGDSCRSVMLNGKKLYWLDRSEDIRRLGLWATRLYFTTEGPQEVDQVLRAYSQGLPFDPGACTRGLYLRGVE